MCNISILIILICINNNNINNIINEIMCNINV